MENQPEQNQLERTTRFRQQFTILPLSARTGAKVGTVASLLYSTPLMVYLIGLFLRKDWELQRWDEIDTWLNLAFIVFMSLIFLLIVSLISALIGSVTAMVIGFCINQLFQYLTVVYAMMLSMIITTPLILWLNYLELKNPPPSSTVWPDSSYFMLVGFPSLIYMASSVVAARIIYSAISMRR